jgi:hypothetical protein
MCELGPKSGAPFVDERCCVLPDLGVAAENIGMVEDDARGTAFRNQAGIVSKLSPPSARDRHHARAPGPDGEHEIGRQPAHT